MGFIDAVPYLGIVVAGFMAFAIGANDVANALGTSVGSGALTIRKAIILGGIFEFLGTIIMGRFVTGTIKSGIIDISVYQDSMDRLALGMFCAVLAATIWLLVATVFSLPVSTTHTIVAGIFSFAIVEKGTAAIKFGGIGFVLLSWLISPLMGCAIAFGLYYAINKTVIKTISPFESAIKLLPIFTGITVSVLGAFIIVSEAPLAKVKVPWWATFIIIIGLFLITAPIIKWIVIPWYLKRTDAPKPYSNISEGVQLEALNGNSDEDNTVQLEPGSPEAEEAARLEIEEEESFAPARRAEEQFKPLMILTAVFVAFAHGSNDVANAIGPAAALWEFKQAGKISASGGEVPFWLLLLGGIGIVVGLSVLGYKVMKTIGEKITKLTHARGYAAQLAAATTVMLASFFGLPISTTHTLVGSVTGIGLVPGTVQAGGLNRAMLLKILIGWVVTIVAGCVGTILLYVSLRPLL